MRFRVLSYNILHEYGAKRLNRFHQGAWYRGRVARLAAQIRQLSPDIACLQEVDDTTLSTIMTELGSDFSCGVRMLNETLSPQDGCAILIRTSRFKVIGEPHCFRLRDVVQDHFPQAADIQARGAGLGAALWRELRAKMNLAVALHLRSCQSGQEGNMDPQLSVISSHLYWDPKYPDIKLLQAFFLASELSRFSGNGPAILGADMNSTPALGGDADGTGDLSGVYKLLTQGSVAPEHPHHPVTLRPSKSILRGVGLDDVPVLETEPFRSAYQEAFGVEGPYTNYTREFRGVLDYILYRGRGLHLCSAIPLPAPEKLKAAGPLPSIDFPSDHLPLVVDFTLGPCN